MVDILCAAVKYADSSVCFDTVVCNCSLLWSNSLHWNFNNGSNLQKGLLVNDNHEAFQPGDD